MNRIVRFAIVGAVVLGAQVVLAADKAPDKLPNGERPWPAVAEAEVQAIRAVLPEKAPVAPHKQRKLLVFYRADRFPHMAIPAWNKMLELLGEKTGAYRATLSQNYDDLSPERLQGFDAVFFNNTCGMMMPEPAKAALQQYVKSGKGFAGNHGAGDTWHDWPEGLAMLGAEFASHPFRRIQVKIDDPQSPLTAVFGGKTFPFTDEIYAFKAPYSREKVRVLLSIDYPNSPDVQKAEEALRQRGGKATAPIRADHDYAVAWIHPWGQGRFFYCSLGHRMEIAWDPAIVRFFLAGIQYALGDLKADDAPVVVAK